MAKILKIYPENPQENLIAEVVKTLNNGGLIIYPSDTVYALGCNIFDIRAMEKLAQIKKIKLEKAQFSIICNDLSHLSEFTRPIDTSTFRYLKNNVPGPFTFILEANKSLPLAYKGNKTVGIRVPDQLSLSLARLQARRLATRRLSPPSATGCPHASRPLRQRPCGC